MTARVAVVVLVAALLAACATPTPNMKTEAKARLEMGVGHLRQKNLPAAMSELTKASALDPDNPEIDMVLGLTYQARGDPKNAEKFLRRAIDKKSDYAEAHNNLGYFLSTQGRSKEAVREYEKAASNVLYQTPEVACTNMGEEYRRMKEPGKAEQMYRRAIAFNPRYVSAYRGLSALQTAANRWTDAAKTLGQCTQFAPDYWACWMDLGTVQLRLGKKRDALSSFKRVLSGSEDPDQRKKAADYINLLQPQAR